MILHKELYQKHGLLPGIYLILKVTSIRILRVILGIDEKQFLGKNDAFINRTRGLPFLTYTEAGELACDACGLCQSYCPSHCIEIESSQKNKVTDFKIDPLRCIFCGFCVEACPIDAIRMGEGTQLAIHGEAREKLKNNKLSLVTNQEKNQHIISSIKNEERLSLEP